MARRWAEASSLPLVTCFASVVAFPAIADTAVGAVRQFKDWIVGCDNTRRCTALGLPEADDSGAYVKLERAGSSDAPPVASVTIVLDGPAQATALQLGFDKGGAAGALAVPLPANANGNYHTADVPTAAVGAMVAALSAHRTMQVSSQDGSSETVSLAGSAAALRYLDEIQGRAGSADALLSPGTGTSSAGSAPATPSIAARKMIAATPPLPARPAGLALSSDPSCKDVDDSVLDLGGGLTLWGVCQQAAAYNVDYAYWLIGRAAPIRVKFMLPGRDGGADAATLTNPGLSDDGLTLNGTFLDEGPGDCGTSADWAWDGSALRLVRYSELRLCRGVPPGDWPVLYRAWRD